MVSHISFLLSLLGLDLAIRAPLVFLQKKSSMRSVDDRIEDRSCAPLSCRPPAQVHLGAQPMLPAIAGRAHILTTNRRNTASSQ